ncbi:hypothetical protein FRB94_011246 [Tulasnella sp. JGI-2019a]|nr:hypothetical protein FRB93_002423 [Tulasnella sp. JGI-2019a]KAG9009964.1 hypothetical protein FRB94_011246 [Tulasnella sp. JGI-2019a]
MANQNVEQYWKILNLDAREVERGTGTLRNLLFFDYDGPLCDHIIPRICIPRKVSFDEVIKATHQAYAAAPRSATSNAKIAEEKCFLIHQPIDIIGLIFASIENIQDAISLALTSRQLLAFGLDRIGQLFELFYAPWAGDRLICIGEFAKNDDLPPGVLTPGEQAIFEVDGDNLYECAQRNFNFRTVNLSSRYNLDDDFAHRLLSVEIKQFRAILDTTKQTLDNRVLCNLSKRLYFRRHVGTALEDAELGGFLLSHICWSSDPSTGMGNIHRGIWAGDRFEITTLDRLKGGADSWKDVS